MVDLPSEIKNCSHCNIALEGEFRFCPACGCRIGHEVVNEKKVETNLVVVFLFFFPMLMANLIFSQVGEIDKYEEFLYLDLGFTAFMFFFIAADFKKMLPLLSIQDFKLKIAASIILTSIVFAFAVHLFANFINESLFDQFVTDNYLIFKDSPYPFLLTVLMVCVQPAIFEELSFRGFAYTRLNEAMGLVTAVFVSSFIFGLIHLSFISLLWLIPIGLFYAWLRNRYSTLWYGMIAHFMHNFTIVMIEMYNDNFGYFI